MYETFSMYLQTMSGTFVSFPSIQFATTDESRQNNLNKKWAS